MTIEFLKFACPQCERQLKIRSLERHKKIFCPRCNSILQEDGENEFVMIPDKNVLFGPPVHRDFIKAELIEAGEIPPVAVSNDYVFVDGEIRDDFSKARAWASEKSEKQSRLDEILQQIGIGLAVLGIALLLIPYIRAMVNSNSMLPVDLSVLGLAIGVVSVALLAVANRRQLSRVGKVTLGLGLPVVGLALFAPTPVVEVAPPESAYLPDSHPNVNSDGPGDVFVGHNAPSPASSHKPNARKPDLQPADPEIRKPSRFERRFAVSPAKKDSRLKELDRNNKPGPNEPTVPLTEDTSKQSLAEMKAEFDEAMKLWEINEALPESRKASVLKSRVGQFHECRIDRKSSNSEDFKNDFVVSYAAGRETVFGKAIFRKLPVHGIDVAIGESQELEHFVPILAGPDFDSSIAWDSNYFLVGLNVNRDTVVIGVQGIFAPVVGGEIQTDDFVVGPWFGIATDDPDRIDTVESGGAPVYGIVVYRDKLDIVGLALVMGR